MQYYMTVFFMCRHNRGNPYLQENFPRLDYILSCHVISNDYTIKTESLIHTVAAAAADVTVTDPPIAPLQAATESGSESDKDALPADVTSEVGEGSNPDALSGVDNIDNAVKEDVDSPRDLKAESSSGLIDEKKLQFMQNEHQRQKEPDITLPVPKGHNSDLLNLIEEKTNNVKTTYEVPTQQYLRNVQDKYELLLDHPNSISFMLSPPFILLATGLMCVGVCVVYILRVRKQSVARHKSY